ncbi:MAG: MFS transporter [Bacteroidales bacterium]|nr:MFS transporter [Bacteroidales bacterium]
MSLYSYFRISKPSPDKVPAERQESVYKSLRSSTFWGVTLAYCMYYFTRMGMSVVKQPLIDGGVLSPGELGLVGSAFLFVYAVGKCVNGFIADYCNIRRFMAVGLVVSAVVNLLMALIGYYYESVEGVTYARYFVYMSFFLLWGFNGWAQSMGSPPGVISLSRWFPKSRRGTFYSLFSSSPYVGKFLSLFLMGMIVEAFSWESGFLMASFAGLVGTLIIVFMVSDTPESKGLPSVQELSAEPVTKVDTTPTRELQKWVLKHRGIWIIALASAFIYIAEYAVSGWGVLFLQKARGFSLEDATQIIAYAISFGAVGTVLAGWLSDYIFKGNRVRPTLISGVICTVSLGLFLFTEADYFMNIVYVSVFSMAMGALYCIVAGLMALDIVPRKATGAALGVVGVVSYVAAGLQEVTSGYLIEFNTQVLGDEKVYDFGPVSWFWLVAVVLSFLLPVLNWKRLKS